MKRDRLFSGLLLLGIGILFLLDNFNVIDFHWANIISLWPLFLIVPGINLVFAHQDAAWATTVKILALVAVFALVFYRGTRPTDNQFWSHQFNNKNFFYDETGSDNADNKEGVFNKVAGTSAYNEPFTPTIKTASLNIRGGGATYTLQDTTAALFNAVTHELSGKFVFNTAQIDSGKIINFSTKNNGRSINWDNDNDDKGNEAVIKLNANPVWNINISAGASKVDFDLSKFKISNLEVKGGAASMDLKLGEPKTQNMMVNVSTGVSEVSISVPENAACQIISKTGLSSKSFNGFESKGNNQYETPGFATATNKIYLNLKGGISDFKVNRY